MISYKVAQRGFLNILQAYIFPALLEVAFLVMCVVMLSGLTEDRDTTGSLVLGIGFGLAALGLPPSMVAMALSQWVFFTDDEVRWKSTKPFDYTIFWCPWNTIDRVRVWSDKMPSDPVAKIQRISIHRPFTESSRYGSHPTYLNIDDSVAEIRQIMDLINTKIADKVIWEVR